MAASAREGRHADVGGGRLGRRARALAGAVPGSVEPRGAAPLGAGLPQGPAPAGRAQERRAARGAGRARRPGDTEQLHHFISGSPWATGPLEAILTTQADRLVGGPDAVLVIDDTALPKQGRHSVGVARQYR